MMMRDGTAGWKDHRSAQGTDEDLYEKEVVPLYRPASPAARSLSTSKAARALARVLEERSSRVGTTWCI